MSRDMTEAELLEALVTELRAQDAGPEDARTTLEWVPMFGLRDDEAVRRRIKALLRAGHMESCWVKRQNMAGNPTTVPAYRLTGTK